jgi:hypothetical protein
VNAVDSHLRGHTGDALGTCGTIPCNLSVSSQSSFIMHAESITTEEDLRVIVMPNPTTTYFTLKIESKYKTPIELRVMDAAGRVVEAKSKIEPNSNIQIGYSYNIGTFYAEIVQDTRRKVVRLIKAY